ncbi:MAG: EamA family transporter [Acidimicrobiales bacterium]|nr:EamA family transporter [Acidimicrobiales bacterium]
MLWVTGVLGACFVAIRLGQPYAPPLWFATLRAVLAGVVLVGYSACRRQRPPTGVRQWGLVGGLGLANATIGFGAMFLAAARLSTGIASVLANAQPLLIVLPAWLLYRERPRPAAMVGLVVGMAGFIVVALPGGVGSGAALAIGAAAAATVGTLLARRLGILNDVVAAGWSFLIGGAVLALWAGLAEGVPHIHVTWGLVASLAFLAIPGTAGVYVAWFHEARRCPLYRLAAWTFAVPAFGLLLGVLIKGDRPSAWTAAGLGIVLTSLWLVLRGGRPVGRASSPRSDPVA